MLRNFSGHTHEVGVAQDEMTKFNGSGGRNRFVISFDKRE